MASISEQRAALAAALSAVDGVAVRTRTVKTPRPGDGWVIVNRVEPAGYLSCSATLTAVVVLGPDEQAADDRLEALSVPLLDAATKGDLHPDGVVLEPVLLPAGTAGPAPVYGLTLTLNVEVD